MTHLKEEDLVEAYYGADAEECREHLRQCQACRAELARMAELLDELRTVPMPARNEAYGREMWARLESRLPIQRGRWWARPWILTPAAAALLSTAFLAGMLTMRNHQSGAAQQLGSGNRAAVSSSAISDKDRQRVFLGAMSDHLERSEILLAQLVHASPGELNVADERTRARDLLEENRLLRETAARSGDQAHTALLDDLERVFLDLANSPAQLSSDDAAELRRRIENQGLLFKVRVTNTDARSKGHIL